jgi:hypothetical protein
MKPWLAQRERPNGLGTSLKDLGVRLEENELEVGQGKSSLTFSSMYVALIVYRHTLYVVNKPRAVIATYLQRAAKT